MLHIRVHHIIQLQANGQTKTTGKIISFFLSLSCSYLHVHSYLLLLSHSLQIPSKFLSLFLPLSPSRKNSSLMDILSFLHSSCTFNFLPLFSYILSPFFLFVCPTLIFVSLYRNSRKMIKYSNISYQWQTRFSPRMRGTCSQSYVQTVLVNHTTQFV